MPNHVQNCLTFNDSISVDDIHQFMCDELGNISFQKIHPMPKALDDDAFTPEMIKAADQLIDDQYVNLEGFSQEDQILIRERLDSVLQLYSLSQSPLLESRSYWYRWRLAHWGTKWEAYQHEKISDPRTFKFWTAWSAPIEIYQQLADRFGDDAFCVDFADEDLGNNCGQITVHGNNLVIEEFDDPRVMACEIWGCDYDEFFGDEDE